MRVRERVSGDMEVLAMPSELIRTGYQGHWSVGSEVATVPKRRLCYPLAKCHLSILFKCHGPTAGIWVPVPLLGATV